jgi:outer membrane protein assembly factor BamB
MKFANILIFLLFIQNCSFDNKTGIWEENDNISNTEKQEVFKDFKTLSSHNDPFEKIINIKKNFKFKLSTPIQNLSWKQTFFNQENNLSNFKYNNLNQVHFKSKKLSKKKISKILYSDDFIITSDTKGDLIIYSIANENSYKFNFYRKKYKNLRKDLNLIVKGDVIYVSDNIGYLYAFDFKRKKILWAKNYKIPFRSNLKIFNNKIAASNQNNNLYFFDIKTGEILRLIPTDQTLVVNKFKSSMSINKNILFYLNTYGSLYSVNLESLRVNWFLNLNSFSKINSSKIFSASQIINNNKNIIVSTDQFTYIIDSKNGNIKNKINFSSKKNLVMSNNYLFLITKNNLLIAMNLENGKIIYSYNLYKTVLKSSKLKKETDIKKLLLVNNFLYIFFNNSKLFKLNARGEKMEEIELPSSISSQPIFVNEYLLYLDKKNKLIILN